MKTKTIKKVYETYLRNKKPVNEISVDIRNKKKKRK